MPEWSAIIFEKARWSHESNQEVQTAPAEYRMTEEMGSPGVALGSLRVKSWITYQRKLHPN